MAGLTAATCTGTGCHAGGARMRGGDRGPGRRRPHLREQRGHLALPQRVAQLQLQHKPQLALRLRVQHIQPRLGGGVGWAHARLQPGTQLPMPSPGCKHGRPHPSCGCWATPASGAGRGGAPTEGSCSASSPTWGPLPCVKHTRNPASTSCRTAAAACRALRSWLSWVRASPRLSSALPPKATTTVGGPPWLPASDAPGKALERTSVLPVCTCAGKAQVGMRCTQHFLTGITAAVADSAVESTSAALART